jgi:hypothetical protein
MDTSKIITDVFNAIAESLGIEGGISNIFGWAVAIGGTIALGIIIFGGILHTASAGNETKQKEAMEWIKAAVWGLVLLLGSYLLLNLINPDILSLRQNGISSFSVEIPKHEFPADEALSSEEQKLRDLLRQNGINIVSTGSCSIQGDASCTSLEGFPEWAAERLLSFKDNCKQYAAKFFANKACPITITGGTEVGHQSHGPGNPVLDLAKNPALEKYILENKAATVQTSLGSLYTIKSADGDITILNEENHFHITFKK